MSNCLWQTRKNCSGCGGAIAVQLQWLKMQQVLRIARAVGWHQKRLLPTMLVSRIMFGNSLNQSAHGARDSFLEKRAWSLGGKWRNVALPCLSASCLFQSPVWVAFSRLASSQQVRSLPGLGSVFRYHQAWEVEMSARFGTVVVVVGWRDGAVRRW